MNDLLIKKIDNFINKQEESEIEETSIQLQDERNLSVDFSFYYDKNISQEDMKKFGILNWEKRILKLFKRIPLAVYDNVSIAIVHPKNKFEGETYNSSYEKTQDFITLNADVEIRTNIPIEKLLLHELKHRIEDLDIPLTRNEKNKFNLVIRKE